MCPLVSDFVNKTNKSGQTPLIFASDNGNFACTKLLLDENVNPELKDNILENALHKGCYKGFADIVELLVSKVKNIDERNAYGETPLFLAVKGDHILIIHLLLKNKANPNAQNLRGEVPLNVALSVEAKELLGQFGGEIRKRRRRQ
eukprot:GCRY01003046.1.p1 GENE.GCRY01003046.1~~GCRY01003046.1.p1  ORF type:complete len:146 (-),score=12.24 GCRY01003046.1:92-529(-)